MKRNPDATFPALSWLECKRSALLLTAFLSPAGAATAAIDEQANQAVWKLTYGVTDAQLTSAAWLAADDDGDGASNQDELNAGTNPFQRDSVLKVSALSGDANTVSLSFATLPKKL